MKSLTAKKALGYRNEIYGIAALWIILFHVADYTTPMSISPLEGDSMCCMVVNFINKIFTILRTIFLKGNTGVDIFLFLSAIGYISLTIIIISVLFTKEDLIG